jgi:hypothetical protein
MTARVWLWTNIALAVGWSVMLVICLTPLGRPLANSLTYLTAISHAALVLACVAAVAGARAERAAESDGGS